MGLTRRHVSGSASVSEEVEPELPPERKLKSTKMLAPAISLCFLIILGAFSYLFFFQENLYTPEELAKFDGSDPRKPVLLAYLGEVFDVSAGRKHYGAEGGYQHFSGRDATRAYVTGKFSGEGLTDDLSGLSLSEMGGIADWRTFYPKTYKRVGKVVGRYYDAWGKPTAELQRVEAAFLDAAKAKEVEKADEARHPNCNSRWSREEGGKVWCSDGYPRKVFVKGEHNPQNPRLRCACFLEHELDRPDQQVYEDCAARAQTCQTSPPEAP